MTINTPMLRLLSRQLSAVVALVFLGIAFRYLFAIEPALGTVRGRVLMSENSQPLSGAEITLSLNAADGMDSEDIRATPNRYAKSKNDGSFELNRVPAGVYLISASSPAHSTTHLQQYVSVDEGVITPVELKMERSQALFELHQGQVIFGTSEKPRLGFTGYVGFQKPGAQDSMHLTVWKTRLSRVLQDADTENALDQVGRGYNHAKMVPTSLLHPAQGPAPQKVIDRDIPITEGDKEGFFHKRYNFESLPVGLYLVEVNHERDMGLATHGRDVDCTWLLVTDTALVVKRAREQMVAYAVDMKTGTPLPNSDIRAYQAGKVVAQAQTDPNGLAELTLTDLTSRHVSKPVEPGDDSGDNEGDSEGGDPPNSKRITTVAVRGDDEAVVSKDFYRNEEAGDFTIHAYTDRPIYRPGQRIYFKAIVRANVVHDTAAVTPSGDQPVETNRYTVPKHAPITVEIRDPAGDKILHQTGVTSAHGSYWGQVDLDSEAPTGVYSLITTIGGEEHTHDIVIASYQKPEFTVTVTPDQKRYARGDMVTMTVNAEYYFGAPVVGAKVEYTVYRDPEYTSNSEDEDEDDSDGSDEPDTRGMGDAFYGATVTHGETRLDDNGKVVVRFKADSPEDPEGPQQDKYTLSCTVTEGEDREVTADGAAHVTTGDFDLNVSPEGWLASPGQQTSVLVSARDPDGKPVPNVAIEVETGYHHWEMGEYSYQTVGTQHLSLGPEGTVAVPVVPPRQGELMVKVRAWDSHKHKIVARAYIWVEGDAGGDLDTEYADLSLHTDKKRYNPGETARVLINSVRTGETVLLTIEGERVYHTRIVPMTKRSTVVKVPIPADYGPNVFLAACYVKDKKFATSETPLRVNMPQKQITVHITADRDPNAGTSTAPARYHPEDKITYQIQTTDSEGKPVPAELSFGVVDEAIYALKEDSPNALRDEFYPRRTNEVSTDYSFAIAFMGDADKSEPQIVTRKKFPDTAYWNPNLTTDAQGHATVRFALPDSLTTWRATATAHTDDTRVGRAIEKIQVTKEFLVRLEAPRFLTQKDLSRLFTVVHNDTGTTQTATVKLEVQGLILEGKDTQTVTLEAGKNGEMVWPVTATDTGPASPISGETSAKVVVKAWTTGGSGPQYTDGLESSFPIRPHGRELAKAIAGQVTADHPQTETVQLDPNVVSGTARLTVRITPSLSSSLLGATDYLIGFPYGCTEQTMSRFLPDLLVQRALRLHGLSDTEHTQRIPQMVEKGLLRLYQFQHQDTGGWGWWEHDKDDPWMTAYVLYGLAEAQKDGYKVSAAVLDKGRKAAAKMAQDKTITPDNRVFLLYGLARVGDTATARAEKDKIKLIDLHSQAVGYMVLLDEVLGESPALPLYQLEKQTIVGDSMVHWSMHPDYDHWYWDWDDLEATSVGLRALLSVNRQDVRIGSILRWLMLHRTGSYWGNTRDTSWVLAAFCDYLSGQSALKPGGAVQISLNGVPVQTYPLTPENLKEKELTLHIPPASLRPTTNTVTLERTGGNSPVYYSVEWKQIVGAEDMQAIAPVMPITAHLLSAPAHTGLKGGDPRNQLIVKREYLRVTSQKTGDYYTLQTTPTNNQLTEGDRIRVRITIEAPRNMDYVLIEDPLPAGCEVTERGDAAEVVDWGYWYDSIDVRDDRVAFFVRSLSQGEHVIEYNVRAKTHGSYHAMPTLLQAMYSPDMHAESAEDRVMIR